VILDATEVLELDVGRVADHAVKPAVAEDLGEAPVPVEDVHAIEGLVREQSGGEHLVKIWSNEGVATDNRGVKRRERAPWRRGVHPQRELADLDRLRVDVDAIEVSREDICDDLVGIKKLLSASDALRLVGDPAVLGLEGLQGLNEEGA
jgi:hypothetical protein